MVTKRKPINRLDYGKGIYSKKSTLSYSNDNRRKKRDTISKTPTIGL